MDRELTAKRVYRYIKPVRACYNAAVTKDCNKKCYIDKLPNVLFAKIWQYLPLQIGIVPSKMIFDGAEIEANYYLYNKQLRLLFNYCFRNKYYGNNGLIKDLPIHLIINLDDDSVIFQLKSIRNNRCANIRRHNIDKLLNKIQKIIVSFNIEICEIGQYGSESFNSLIQSIIGNSNSKIIIFHNDIPIQCFINESVEIIITPHQYNLDRSVLEQYFKNEISSNTLKVKHMIYSTGRTYNIKKCFDPKCEKLFFDYRCANPNCKVEEIGCLSHQKNIPTVNCKHSCECCKRNCFICKRRPHYIGCPLGTYWKPLQCYNRLHLKCINSEIFCGDKINGHKFN